MISYTTNRLKLCTYQCYAPPPPIRDMWGFVWGFDFIKMQISHVWGTFYEQIPLLSWAANHDHFHFLTHLHSDITEKFILPLNNKINAGSNWSLVVRLTDSSVQQICVYIILYAFINSQNQMPHLWGRFCGLKGEKSTHNSPSQPRRGVVGPNIDRCIIMKHYRAKPSASLLWS